MKRLSYVLWIAIWFGGMAAMIVMIIIAAGCVAVPPPVITPQPPPTSSFVMGVTVRAESGQPLPGASGSATADFGQPIPCVMDAAHARLSCTLPVGATSGDLDIDAENFQHFNKHYAPFPANLDVNLKPTAKALTRLVGEGQHLRGVDGSRFTVIESTDFNLAGRLANGEDIGPVLDQRAAVGFTVVRVFTAYDVCPEGNGCQAIGRLIPREHPDLYSRILPDLIDQASRRDLRVELVAFTGPYTFFANDDEKVAHAKGVEDVACSRIGNVLFELVNEGDHVANKDIPYGRLPQPSCGVLASHGSSTQDSTPRQPYWSLVTFHPAGSEWQRKSGHNAMELWGGPSYSNETTRFPDNDADCQHAYDAAAGNTLLSAGGNYHSVAGKRSGLWGGTELACAQAFVAGARSVPLACQDGGYRHRDDLEGPLVIRAYQRGGDDRCIVKIRP